MKRLELLDYGRFFAAAIVVFFHYTFNGIAGGKIASIEHVPWVIASTKYGYLGVPLFFMISGYVIFFSARNGTAAKFAVSRAVRLYPAYWFAVLFTSFFAWLWGAGFMSVSAGQVIANLSMLQSLLGFPHVDNVYWTLMYEIIFYGGVLFLLLCGLQRQLNNIFISWPALFLVALALGINSLPYLGGYYYFFSAGALFAVLKNQFSWRAVASLLLVYAFCMVYSIKIAASMTVKKSVDFSPVIIALVVTIFFVFFAYQNTKKAQTLALPWSRTLGALTYPIYLVHAHFGYMVINKFATEENQFLVYAATIFVVFMVAFFINKVIEKKFSAFWLSTFDTILGRPVKAVSRFLVRVGVVRDESSESAPLVSRSAG